MPLSGKTKKCECGREMPIERPYDYCQECSKHKPKERYVVAGFGTKGNGAHVTKFTHGSKSGE